MNIVGIELDATLLQLEKAIMEYMKLSESDRKTIRAHLYKTHGNIGKTLFDKNCSDYSFAGEIYVRLINEPEPEDVSITHANWGDYRELHFVTEYKDGHVFATKHLGYVNANYIPKTNQIVSPLSTTTIGQTIKVKG